METDKNSGSQLNEERKSNFPQHNESQKDGTMIDDDDPVTQNVSNLVEEGDVNYDDEELEDDELKDEDFDIDEDDPDEDE